MAQARLYDHVYWYLSEVTSKVVAKSGIPTDRCHIGKIVLQSFEDDLDFVAQIDGGTGKSETNGSLLKRSVQCAISFKQMGLKHGDVMVLMAPSHLEIAVTFYAALYLGVVIAPIDRTLKVGELEHTFRYYKPSIVICHSEKTQDVEAALEILNIKANIVTFEKQINGTCLADLLIAEDEEVNNFKAADFNAEESIATILPTSGTTAFSKGAALPYKTLMITGPHIWARFMKFPSPTRMRLSLSPPQWVSAAVPYLIAPVMKYTQLLTSKSVTVDHTRYLIDTYKPTYAMLSPTMLMQLSKLSEYGQCDMTCLEVISVAGSVVDKNILEHSKANLSNTTVMNSYGMVELSTVAFQGDCPLGSVGKPSGIFQHRLVNIDTQEDIKEPYVNGELWVKGPMFKGYYNNPKATEEAFAENGWFKTGDLFYRDEHWNFYFVERIKLLIDYNPGQMVSPTEIESVIRSHPNVMDVAVTGIPDPEYGELPAACVITEPGCSVTSQEVKDLVKEKLCDAKQLRGGVAFVSSFPLTASSKINRKILNEMVVSPGTEAVNVYGMSELNLARNLSVHSLEYRISPVKLEAVIIQHPGVLEVAVTALPDREYGDLPVAGCDVTAHDIKDIIKKDLSDSKQLRGGVVFFDALPMMTSTKLHRRKIKEIVFKMKIE